MRKSILCLLSLLPLGGCATAYQGVYRTDCHLTKSELHIRAIKVTREILGEVGVEPNVKFVSTGEVSTKVEVPYKVEVGVTVPPRVDIFEFNGTLVAVVDTDGDGTRPESQKLREVVQQVLTHNDCALEIRREQVRPGQILGS